MRPGKERHNQNRFSSQVEITMSKNYATYDANPVYGERLAANVSLGKQLKRALSKELICGTAFKIVILVNA